MIPPLELDLLGAGIFAIGAVVIVFARPVTKVLKIVYGRIYGEWSAKPISVWAIRAWGAVCVALGGGMLVGGIVLASTGQ